MSDMTSSTAAGTADRAAASGRYTGADLTTGDLVPTPAQTIGPFYGFALEYEHGNELGARGQCASGAPARHGDRRCRHPGPRCAAGDLAGR